MRSLLLIVLATVVTGTHVCEQAELFLAEYYRDKDPFEEIISRKILNESLHRRHILRVVSLTWKLKPHTSVTYRVRAIAGWITRAMGPFDTPESVTEKVFSLLHYYDEREICKAVDLLRNEERIRTYTARYGEFGSKKRMAYIAMQECIPLLRLEAERQGIPNQVNPYETKIEQYTSIISRWTSP